MSVQEIRFEKYHGTGNDFVLVDAEAPVCDRPEFARQCCDRLDGVTPPKRESHDSDGVSPDPATEPDAEFDPELDTDLGSATDGGTARTGADGVLFLGLDAQFSPGRIVTTLVKPDGSVAATTGNGARCAAAWAATRTGDREFMLDTPAGTRRARVDADGSAVTVEMGVPTFEPRGVSLALETPLIEESMGELTVTAVDVGTTHAVAFVDDVDDVDLPAVAPSIRHDEVFLRGANVTIASPDGDGGFRQRTYEVGVEGETRSCGTGAVAIVAAAKRTGRLPADAGEVRVSPPGGNLYVEVPERGTASLRGPVAREFGGVVDPAGHMLE
jgi:diaminopimelate epimerase